MASMSMISSSFFSGSAAVAAVAATASRQLPSTACHGAVVVRASNDWEKIAVDGKEERSNNTRRDLMFGIAAAAVCSVAKVAAADELKRGSPEAKKKYAPVCVTMPTARICRN